MNQWHLHGPLLHLHELDATAPAMVLPGEQRQVTLAPSLWPQVNQRALYVLSREDESGRVERSATCVVISRAGEQAVAPPLMPNWPDEPDWNVLVNRGQAWLTVVFDRPLRESHVDTIELLIWVDGGESPVVWPVAFNLAETCVHVRVPVGETGRWFEFQFTHQGLTWRTPRSRRVAPIAGTLPALQVTPW